MKLPTWNIGYNSNITEYLAWIYPYSRVDAENYWRSSQQNANEQLYSIVTSDSRMHIGSVSLKRIDWRSRNAELSIVLGVRELWGKGYGQDAVQTMCRFAFKQLGLNRIYLYVRADHEAGIRAYEKAGFKHEGIARQQLYRNGEYHDLILLGLLAQEFVAN